MIIFAFPIGEAANPGPEEHLCRPQIGCLNPNGLLGKGHLFRHMPAGAGGTIWAVSETHLTQPGHRKFAQELKHNHTGFQIQMGAPVPPKSASISAVGGKHRGVGFIATMPCRAMTATWTPELWAENRVHAATFQFGHRSVQGGVVYGHAVQPESILTKQRTDLQCRALTARLVHHSRGLRFIAGDFNQVDGGVTSMVEWANSGWINIQKWAFDVLGKAIQNTCHGTTTKDHVFVSPELAMYLHDVATDDSWFSDHALLWATFDPFGHPPLLPLWRQVKPLPWDECQQRTMRTAPTPLTGSPADQYQQLRNQMEEDVVADLAKKGRMCPSQCLGRAKTREVHWVQEFAIPPRQGRQGDVQPEFHGIDLLHAQWTCQLRRLMNLQKLVAKTHLSSSQFQHCHGLWRKIKHSPGFRPNFILWWIKHAPQHLPELPDDPPSPAVAKSIAMHFESHFRNYEKALLRTRCQKARQRRADDPQIIFRDIKGEPPAPVQLLVHRTRASVTGADPEFQAIEVHPPQKWDPSRSLLLDGKPYAIVHAEPDKLWIDPFPDSEIPTIASQEIELGDLPSIFQAFGKEWQARWDKHLDLPADHWEPALAMIDRYLPPLPSMELEPITPELWLRTLRNKSRRAAVGPDSVTRQDLLNMDPVHIQQLLDILHQVEQTGQWPQQMLDAFVIALEKQPSADEVKQFRPICILPVCYRTWSSIRGRQILKHLGPHAPATCLGNLPGKSATQVWHKLMIDIELGQAQGSTHGGGVIDLVKAYNLLPRIPVLAVMHRLGIHPCILRAWNGALHGIARRFKIRSCTGPALRSTTGFPEGCALSVTSMLGLNFLCHAYCSAIQPRCNLWSYVDNLEISSSTPEGVLAGMHGLQRFWSMLEVDIDPAKSYCWSIASQARQVLRQHEWPTRHWARDLGGHVQYSMQRTNSTITRRCEAIKPLWNRVARSLAPYRQKIRALRAKAWPNSLHGCQSVHMADEHFQHLRTGAVQSLGEHKPGTSPLLHLGAIENPMHDPQCYALVHTVLMFRDMQPALEELDFAMQLYHQPGDTVQPKPGPFSVMLARLHQIAWTWLSGVVFHDQHGLPCDILQCPIQELRVRLCTAWQARILAQCATRKTMQGLQSMNPALTVEQLLHWPDEDQALLRTCLNGTFFTADRRKHHHDNPSTDCRYCGVPDSQWHRHWECPHFATCRSIQPDLLPDLQQLPLAITCHGWMPEPPDLVPFRRACVEVYLSTPDWHLPPQLPQHLHLFTDGACKHPQCSFARIAAWSFVLAQLPADTFWPVAHGILPGWTQTILRAEIWAALQACLFALQVGIPCTLWVDNALVYRRLQQFRSHPCWVKPNQKDSDLWSALYKAVQALGSKLVAVAKVSSHQDLSEAGDDVEYWAFRGNSAADSLAEDGYDTQPQLMKIWNRLVIQIGQTRTLRAAIHETMVRVGRTAVRSQPQLPEETAVVRAPRLTQADVLPVQLVAAKMEELPPHLQFDGCQQLLDWIPGLDNEAEECRLVSWFQLNVLCEADLQFRGVAYNTRQRQWGRAVERPHADFARRTNLLARYIRAVMDSTGGQVRPAHVRPHSGVVQFWTQCIATRLPYVAWQRADNLLRDQQARLYSVKEVRGLV